MALEREPSACDLQRRPWHCPQHPEGDRSLRGDFESTRPAAVFSGQRRKFSRALSMRRRDAAREGDRVDVDCARVRESGIQRDERRLHPLDEFVAALRGVFRHGSGAGKNGAPRAGDGRQSARVGAHRDRAQAQAHAVLTDGALVLRGFCFYTRLRPHV